MDLDPTSEHKLEEARIVDIEEAIHAANNSGWLHHAVSKPSSAAFEWCDYRNVPQGYDKITGYELGCHGPKTFTPDSPDLLNKKKKTGKSSVGNRKRKAGKPRGNKKSPKQRKFHFI